MNDARCKNCNHAIFDDVFGEYKCKKKQRRCTESEMVMGCDRYEKPGTKPGEATPKHVIHSGATFTPNVSEDGVISWTNDKDLPNPRPVNIMGKPGKDGAIGRDGVDGKDGKDGYTPVKGVDYFDGEPGKDGQPGVNGKDGVDGKTPVKGVDYFTDAEKTDMVNSVLAALPVYNGEVEDA